MRWLAGTGSRAHLVRMRQHLLDHRDARGDRLRRAAVSWMLKVRSSGPSSSFSAPSSALIWFASQPRPTISTPAKLAMPRVAAERAAQHLHALALHVHAAAAAVRQRDDAVDVRKRAQAPRP